MSRDYADDFGIIRVKEGCFMGGPGSGNRDHHLWRSAKKTTVEACHELNTCRLKQDGILQPGVHVKGIWTWKHIDFSIGVRFEVDTRNLAEPLLHLSYIWHSVSTGEPEPIDYSVRLTTTSPRFGGLRWWFICPLATEEVACGRRVGKLLLRPAGQYFGCRTCHQLTYRSRQESHKNESFFRSLAEGSGYEVEEVKREMHETRRLNENRGGALDSSGTNTADELDRAV